MKSAQTATVASSCIETNAKTLRRKPGQPERSNSVSPASKRRGLSLRSHRVALSRQVGLRGGCRPHGLLRNRALCTRWSAVADGRLGGMDGVVAVLEVLQLLRSMARPLPNAPTRGGGVSVVGVGRAGVRGERLIRGCLHGSAHSETNWGG